MGEIDKKNNRDVIDRKRDEMKESLRDEKKQRVRERGNSNQERERVCVWYRESKRDRTERGRDTTEQERERESLLHVRC